MTASNKKRLLAVGAVIAVVIIIGGLSLLMGGKKDKNSGITSLDNGTKYDPASGETYSDPKGKTPDNYGETSDAPLFLGVSNLMDHISLEQAEDLKYGLYHYFKAANKMPKQISVVANTINAIPHDRYSESNVDVVYFDILVDNKTIYKIKLNHFLIDNIQLFMSDPSGNQIYDSGVLTDKAL